MDNLSTAQVEVTEEIIDTPPRYVGFVEPQEEEEAKALIHESLGDGVHACGFQILVAIYTGVEDEYARNKSGEKLSLIDPTRERARDTEQYMSTVGLVVYKGSDCYKAQRFEESGHWCHVGDWVLFQYNANNRIRYNNVPICVVPDDRILLVLKYPHLVTRY